MRHQGDVEQRQESGIMGENKRVGRRRNREHGGGKGRGRRRKEGRGEKGGGRRGGEGKRSTHKVMHSLCLPVQ